MMSNQQTLMKKILVTDVDTSGACLRIAAALAQCLNVRLMVHSKEYTAALAVLSKQHPNVQIRIGKSDHLTMERDIVFTPQKVSEFMANIKNIKTDFFELLQKELV